VLAADDGSALEIVLEGGPISPDFRFEPAVLGRAQFSLSEENDSTGDGDVDGLFGRRLDLVSGGVRSSSSSEDGSRLAGRAMLRTVRLEEVDDGRSMIA
jgi:hypothetical protein